MKNQAKVTCPKHWIPGCICDLNTQKPDERCYIHGHPDWKVCPYCGAFRGEENCITCGCSFGVVKHPYLYTDGALDKYLPTDNKQVIRNSTIKLSDLKKGDCFIEMKDGPIQVAAGDAYITADEIMRYWAVAMEK